MTIIDPSRGPALQTYSGALFYPFDPRPEEIALIDIATALSNEARWGGHTVTMYSVAEHSLYVARLLAKESARVRLGGLLHDCSEAYLRDIPRPLKLHPSFAFYREIEERVQRAIEGVLLPGPPLTEEERALIHLADDKALAQEAYTLLQGGPRGWTPHQSREGLAPLKSPVLPSVVYKAFVRSYQLLLEEVIRESEESL